MAMREKNLDLLRVIATIMVVLNHVATSFVTSNTNNPDISFTIGNLFNSTSRTAVPIFVMLSGAFILDDDRNKEYRYFYKKVYRKILIPLIIWSIAYFTYSMIYEVAKELNHEEGVSYTSPLLNWLNGQPYYHLWYMYMILGLYLISPLLIRLREDIGEKMTLKLGVILIPVGMIITYTSDLFWIISFVKYLGYFILGYSLRKYYSINKTKLLPFLVGTIASASLVFAGTEIIVRLKIHSIDPLIFYGNLSPFVISGAICMYIVFLNLKRVQARISYLADYTFYIYVLHAGILNVIDVIFIKALNYIPSNPSWYIPVKTLVVLILSYFIAKVIRSDKSKLKLISKLKYRLN